MKRFLLLLLVVFPAVCWAVPRYDKDTRRMMDRLDECLADRPRYIARKKDRIESYRKLLEEPRDTRYGIDLCLDLADEYFSFNFDSARVYLHRAINRATEAGEGERLRDAQMRLARLYFKAGYFMEAYERLYHEIDTSALTGRQKEDYLFTLFEFGRDIADNSGMIEQLSIPPRSFWRARLLEMVSPDSERGRFLRMDEAIEEGNFPRVDSLCMALISNITPDARNFAVYAYEMSASAYHQGLDDRQLEWLVRSARCDAINAVRDYASLTVIAQVLNEIDVDRAFRYLRISQEDAVAYNAKLRPWQISQFFLGIEQSYHSRLASMARRQKVFTLILGFLFLTLAVVLWFLAMGFRKLAHTRAKLEEANSALAESNAALKASNDHISESNAVQQAHIIRFLNRMSENVTAMQSYDNNVRNQLKQGHAAELLRQVSISTRVEDELDMFYSTFDSTFLALYPNFVSEFNALLREDARTVSKKPNTLTTEQRVFALILLGIDDSKQIASLLHYSVSTIYNCKVSVKNAALGDRDNFEERVRSIQK